MTSLAGVMAAVTAVTADAQLIFQERFESPVVAGFATNTVPSTKWVGSTQGFGANRRGLCNEAVPTFTTPDGNQGYFFDYTNSGLTTSTNAVPGALTADVTYTLVFNAAVRNSETGSAYQVELVAFMPADGNAARTECRANRPGAILASSIGLVASSDMSKEVSLVFTPTIANTNLGKEIGIRLIKNAGNTLYDNVRLTISGPEAPTLTNARVAQIGTTNVVLGGEVATNGGGTITSWGTTWSASATGTNDNPLAVSGETNGAFTQARTGLAAGTHYFSWGWASNAFGIGFTPSAAEFFTEPEAPAALLLGDVQQTQLTLSWSTNSTMSGTLVLMKEFSAVDTDPQDGSNYTASAVFSTAQDVGGGSRAVYAGGGTNVTVTGLTPNTPYYVKVHGYAGSGTLINYRTNSPSASTNTQAVAGNSAPVITNGAGPLAVTLAEDCGPADLQPVFGLVATDSNATDTLTWSVLVDPTNGSAVVSGAGVSPSSPTAFTYTPATNAAGGDSLEVQVSDGNGGLDAVVVTVAITPVNDPPVASNDTYSTLEGAPLDVAAAGVLANDMDVDSAPLTAVKLSNPAHGAVTLNANGSFTYSPTAGWTGIDSFAYAASDGTTTSSAATVSITVSAIAPLVWDANGGTAGVTDGGGTWLNANQWWNDTANATWNNSVPDSGDIGNGGNGGTLTLGPVSSHRIRFGNFNGTYTLSGGTLSVAYGLSVATNSGAVTIGSPVSGAGGITMSGTNILTLSGSNSYSGATVIKGGTVRLNHAGALPGGTGMSGGGSALTLSGGVVELAAGDFQRALGTGGDQFRITGGGGAVSAPRA